MTERVINIDSLDELDLDQMIKLAWQTEVPYYTAIKWYRWAELYEVPKDCPLPTAWQLKRSLYLRRADLGKLEETRMWLRGNPGAMREYHINHTRGAKGEYRQDREEAKKILEKLIKGDDL